MEKLQLYYEVKPYIVSRPWGNIPIDPVTGKSIYAKFGFTEHNGVDVLPGVGKEVRAPFDYEVRWTLWMPNGGGNVLGIISQKEYEGPNGKPAYVLIDFLHLESFSKFPGGLGYKGKAGDLLAIADNTGFSTGPHTHIQYRWVYKREGVPNGLMDVESNKAHDSFDPEPYRNGKYAKDLVFSFTRDLRLGDTGEDVRELQKYLNQHGFPVASFGAGSPGNETEYFGMLTYRALVKFQKSHSIPATGYFGAITRLAAKL